MIETTRKHWIRNILFGLVLAPYWIYMGYKVVNADEAASWQKGFVLVVTIILVSISVATIVSNVWRLISGKKSPWEEL